MLNKTSQLAADLRRLPDPTPGTRREQLRRQRARIQEYLDTIEQLTAERDSAREHNVILSELADRMLTHTETAQNRVLELEHQLAEREAALLALTDENEALLEQGMRQAADLDLLETRLRVMLED